MAKQTARLDGEEMSGSRIVEVTREEAVAIQKAALVMLIQVPPETRLAHVGLPERYTVDHIRAVYQNLPEFDEESLRARDVITRAARLMAVNAMNALPSVDGEDSERSREFVKATSREVKADGGANTAPRCPKCGYVMCQQFDSQPVNAVADIAIPNGKYICYYCAPAVRASALSSRDAEIKEVLEGLRFRHGCWCELPPNAGSPDHTAACLAARKVWEEVKDVD